MEPFLMMGGVVALVLIPLLNVIYLFIGRHLAATGSEKSRGFSNERFLDAAVTRSLVVGGAIFVVTVLAAGGYEAFHGIW